ncbi:MAG: protein translocase subunit SecD [Actinomycetaceae bacterium]|nr:protein translocase subunit SecD [Actinomycetaceae bacterium]MDY6083263.1 protein translocase subunit SecD [Actinomycetaceae bacterium]
MARSSSTKKTHAPVWRRLVFLIVLILALVTSLAVGSVVTHRSKWVPGFALDLQGGTEIILTPVTTDGSTVTTDDVAQAIEIIRQRVDASGVAEAEITSQGGNNIVVGLPGQPSQETLDLVRTSAVLRMRPVLQTMNPGPLTPAQVSASAGSQAASSEPSSSAAPSSSGSTQPSPAATFSPDELKKQATAMADANKDGKLDDAPTSKPKDPSDLAWVTEKATYDALTLDCSAADVRIEARSDDPAKPLVACGEGGTKYILGPAEIEGTDLTQASSGYDQQNGQWAVNLTFNSAGTKAFTAITQRLVNLPSPQNEFAIVLDGSVISSAVPQQVISGGSAQITGTGITQQTSKVLANQLSFGSLPLTFQVQSEQQISATLGSESLKSGLQAGLIGIILIVLYLLWQYEGLGIISIGSIALATGLSYLVVCLLSWTMGYRLSMAGVVGLIISIGITADSFIVFFERVRDEIREGRALRSAVHYGWERAKRTIIVADSVNLLASVVLYFLAVGSVRGFAFTLGITTVLDLVIVIMFTYPMMTLLIRTKFFGEGHRFSGMDSARLGAVPTYAGRGRVRSPQRTAHSSAADRDDNHSETAVVSADESTDDVPMESADNMSLAQRRAEQRRRARQAQKGEN